LDDKSVSQLHCKGKMPISHYEISASLADIWRYPFDYAAKFGCLLDSVKSLQTLQRFAGAQKIVIRSIILISKSLQTLQGFARGLIRP